jgi:hypothetical protein
MDVPQWVELLATGTVTAVLGAVATPAFRRLFSARQVRAEAARAEADASAVTVGAMVSAFGALRGQLDTVTTEMDDLQSKIRMIIKLITVHEVWDAAMISAAIQHGDNPPDPPPLWPQDVPERDASRT